MIKNSDYYSAVRKEILPLLPARASRVLDVGCGHGSTGSFLKSEQKADFVAGIEIVPEAAQEAKKVLDDVALLNLDQSKALPFPEQSFDLILCLDVLEHLVDPWQALKLLTKYLKPGGAMIISLPNVRNFRVVLPLLLQGTFQYSDSGLLDSTHLRFFTKKSSLELAAYSGLQIELVENTGRKTGSITWIANLLTLGIFREFFDIQYLIRVKK